MSDDHGVTVPRGIAECDAHRPRPAALRLCLIETANRHALRAVGCARVRPSPDRS